MTRQAFTRSEGAQYHYRGTEYDSPRIARILRRYHELRSAAEITAARYEQASSGGAFAYGKEDILCALADIDQGLSVLSPRQKEVVAFLRNGYQNEEIAELLGISTITVKFHIRQGVSRLVAFLNPSQ